MTDLGEPQAKQEVCKQCHGIGYVFRLPRGANPFMMPIEAIARNSRRVPCPNGCKEASHD